MIDVSALWTVTKLAGGVALATLLLDLYRDWWERRMAYRVICEIAQEAGLPLLPRSIFDDLCSGKSLSGEGMPGDQLFRGPRYGLGVVVGIMTGKEQLPNNLDHSDEV